MSARTILKHLYKEGRMTDYQYERIDRCLKARQGVWIPVSERLPDEWQVVIVTDDRGQVFEYELNPINVDKYTTGKWEFLGHEIIAWQPLPEPYKEGGAI